MGFKVLFVGRGDACRSPMAEAFARKVGLRAESAGTLPGTHVTPTAAHVMAEKGLDLTGHRPRRLEFNEVPDFDRVVAMGDDVLASSPALAPHENWGLPSILGQPIQSHRQLRDQIERRVHAMLSEISEWRRV